MVTGFPAMAPVLGACDDELGWSNRNEDIRNGEIIHLEAQKVLGNLQNIVNIHKFNS